LAGRYADVTEWSETSAYKFLTPGKNPEENIQQLQELLRLTQTFSRDIKMVFGIENCKTLSIAKGRLEMRNFTTEGDDTMEVMNEEDIYRYFGHMQSKQIKHAQMKQKIGEEYLNRTKIILKTKYDKSYQCDPNTNF
jgi:hypothetical protein